MANKIKIKRPAGQHKKKEHRRIGRPEGSPQAHLLAQAWALHQEGRLPEAEALYRQILLAEPHHPEALRLLGMLAHQTGESEVAVELLRKALTCRPDCVDTYVTLGVILHEQGRLDEAVASYRQALALQPEYAEVYSNLGETLKEQGKLDEAVASFRRALALQPDSAETHYNLGNALKEQGKLEEAIASYRRVLSMRPEYAEAHNNLGNTLSDQGKLEEAILCYRQALTLMPDYAEAYYNLGNVLSDQGKLEEAVVNYRQALTVWPDFAEAFNNLGNALKDQGKLEEAVANYQHALRLKPNKFDAHSNLLLCLNYLTGNSPSHYLEEARRFGQNVAAQVNGRFLDWRCDVSPKRLCVGLVSGDFRIHSVGFFLENLLTHLDPKHIDLVAYPTQRKEDDLTARIRSHCVAWKPLPGMDDEAAARLIHDDGVHILLDLSGHTGHNRLPVFAWKPAPVQVTWLGYSASTGLAELDFLLADPHVVLPAEEAHFTETIWRLPESYLCFSPPHEAVTVGLLPARQEGRITFASFNNPIKMNDAVVALWARVLHAVPDSLLLLKAKQFSDPTMCEKTRRGFAAYGIAFERLLLEGHVLRREDHLAAYNRVDIALDTFPYNGTTTSVEGLWMGVPFITLRGDRFISHVGESIAHNAGISDWIATDEEEYVAKAVARAADLEQLARLRAGLRQQLLASPLLDGRRFARHFEAAMWGMWRRFRAEP